MKKPKKKPKVSAVDQRAVIGKGVEAGVYTTEVKLRDDRDSGRLVAFMYSDLLPNPTTPISIRVKDDVSDEVAMDRWCKKFNKKSWRLI